MIIVLKNSLYSIVLSAYLLLTISMATSDFLDTERSSFLGFSHECNLSSSTLELVEQLSVAVYGKEMGDRRVRRYFDNYDTPFVGEQKPTAN